jgi:hypothetical protein
MARITHALLQRFLNAPDAFQDMAQVGDIIPHSCAATCTSGAAPLAGQVCIRSTVQVNPCVATGSPPYRATKYFELLPVTCVWQGESRSTYRPVRECETIFYLK